MGGLCEGPIDSTGQRDWSGWIGQEPLRGGQWEVSSAQPKVAGKSVHKYIPLSSPLLDDRSNDAAPHHRRPSGSYTASGRVLQRPEERPVGTMKYAQIINRLLLADDLFWDELQQAGGF